MDKNRITADLLRQILKEYSSSELAEYFESNIATHAPVVLSFILSDLDTSLDDIPNALENIPLLLSASSNIFKFSINSTTPLYIYKMEMSRLNLFPGTESLFVDTQLPAHWYNLLITIAQRFVGRINIRDISELKSDTALLCELFKLSLESHLGEITPPVHWDPECYPLNRDWLKRVWTFIGFDPTLVSSLGALPLLPKGDLYSVNNQLLSITPADSSVEYILCSSDASYSQIENVLVESGAVLIHSHRFIECLDDLVVRELPNGLLTLLEKNSCILKSFICRLNACSNLELFRNVIEVLSLTHSFSVIQIRIIKHLPIFLNMRGHHVELRNDCFLVASGICLPVGIPYPHYLLDSNDTNTLKLYRKLRMRTIDINQFVGNHILTLLKSGKKKVLFEISLWLLKNMKSFSTQLIQELKEIEWIADNTSYPLSSHAKYRKPSALFDPKDVILKEILTNDSCFFPHHKYEPYFYAMNNKQLLNTPTSVTNQCLFEEVIHSAVCNFNLSHVMLWSNRFFNLLLFISHCSKSPLLKINSKIANTLRNSPIVLPSYERPNDYPLCLPFLGEQELVTMSSVVFCSSEEVQLIASVRRCVECSLSNEAADFKSILNSLRCSTSVTGAMLVEQLNTISQTKIQVSDSQKVHRILNTIYASKSIKNLTHNFRTNFVFVKTKNIFIDASQIIKRLEYTLASYYYSFDKLNYSEDAWDLFQQCGACEAISPLQLYEILLNLYEKQCDKKLKDIRFVIKIIDSLAESQDLLEVEDYFLLGEDDLLHLASECVLNDSQTAEASEVKKDGKTYFIVSSLISSQVALKFGAKSLKHTMLGNSWGFCEYVGQYEDLTTRIKSILKDYESSIDVFKELLQNADDAQANVTRVLIDYTSYPHNSLLETSMKNWQGPALYFYNDAQFTEQDFSNIMRIFGQTKAQVNYKIGKFGLGFNTVYHLTDLPSFVSGKYIHMLDPHRRYLVDELKMPGIQVDFVNNNESVVRYHDQFIVFNSKLFECDILKPQPYKGTLFRLPFRPQSVSSDICTKVYDNSQIAELTSRILECAESCIRFLQHITSIEIFEKRITGKANEILLLKVSKRVDLNPFPNGQTFITTNSGHFDEIISNSPVSPISYNQTITITSERSGRKSPKRFIVSYSTGTCECRDFILENDNRSISDFTPVCSVALPLSAIESAEHNADRYTMYCFLPLPVTSPYHMYINGYFALDQSRRGIACTEDGSDRTKWNQNLINDALINAFIELFDCIKTYFSSNKKCSVARYYSLWPLSEQQHSIVWTEFPLAFAKRVIETDKSLFYKENAKWIAYSDANFIVYERYYELSGLKQLFDFVLKHFNTFNLIDIPIDLEAQYLFRILFDNDTRKCYNLERVCLEFIFPNFNTFTLPQIKLVLTSLLPLVLLQEQRWAMDLLSNTPCIPCGRKKHFSLLPPCKVVSPHSKFAMLYKPSDMRTIYPDLAELFETQSDHYKAMLKMNVIDIFLPVDDLIDRCRCQEQYDDNQLRKAHCMLILEYLNVSCMRAHYYAQEELEKLEKELMTVNFLPVWQDEFLIDLELQEPTEFANPDECVPFSLRYIISPDFYAVSEEVSKLSQFEKFLGLNITKNSINIELPIALLRCLQQEEQTVISLNLQDDLSERAGEIYSTIFAYWKKNKETDISEVLKVLEEIQCVWHPMTNSFCRTSSLVCSEKYSQYKSKYLNSFPYTLTKDQELRTTFLGALGVKNDISPQDAYAILADIAAEYHDYIDGRDKLLVNLIIDLTNTFFIDYDEHRFSTETKHVLLSSEFTLCEPSKLRISDMFWEKRKENLSLNSFIHRRILPLSAFNLGASSIRGICFKMKDFAITEFGQHEDIADRINSLKRGFPCGTTIFKELIQNAEDAGASQIAFILDKKDYSSNTRSLCFSEIEQNNWHLYQQYTPSLLVYSDSSFSDQDLRGIQSVGLGGKKERNTIGKFGLGFNAVYHLTDSPCLLTRRSSDCKITFCVFDPFRKHLTLEPGSLPGKRLDFTCDDFKKFKDQFLPYSLQSLNDSGVCNFPELASGDYSLFRIPIMNPDIEIEELLMELLHSLPNLNLFLENITRISLFQRNEDNTTCILGTIKVEITNSITIPIPDALKCGFMKDIQRSVKTIYFEENISKQRSGLGKRKRGNTLPKSWFLFTYKGSVEQLETYCPAISEYKNILEREKLNDEVYAGVAVEIPNDADSDATIQNNCLYSYLPIGDDKPISFPILINAPFILEPERQHIRFRDSNQDSSPNMGWEDVWHSAIIEHLIAPLYTALVLYLRYRDAILSDTLHELSNYYAWYYTLYPDMETLICRNNNNANLLYAVCNQFYSTLYQNNESILIDSSFRHMFCLDRGVFKDSSFSDTPIHGQSHKSKKRIKVSKESPDGVGTFYQSLNTIHLPLTCAPDHIIRSFERFSFTLTRLDQLYLLSFLNTNEDNLCFNNSTQPVLSMGEIETLMGYLFKASLDTVRLYENIPLKISYNGNFCCFSKQVYTFKPKFAPLLPNCAGNFLSADFPQSSITLLESYGFVKALNVEFLSTNLDASQFELKQWILFWEFILRSKFQSHKLISVFGNHALIPIKTRSVATFSLISNLPAVLNIPADKFQREITKEGSNVSGCIVSQKELYKALIRSNCPELNLDYFQNSNLSIISDYLRDLTIHSTITMEAFFAALKLSTYELNYVTFTLAEAASIRNLLYTCNISTLPLREIQLISSLKIFRSHSKDLCSINSNKSCFIIKSTVKIGSKMSNILTNNGILLFKASSNQDTMIKHITTTLKIPMITPKAFFMEYVIHNLPQLDFKEQKDLLNAVEATDFSDDFIDKLKAIKFILIPETMKFHSLNELYSSDVQFHELFFPNYILPREWSEVDSFLLTKAGLHNKPELASILTAAKMICNNEIILESDKDILLSSLVAVLTRDTKLNDDDICLLRTLAKIRFLSVWKFEPDNTSGFIRKFVSFEEAELSEFQNCCCTSAYIHHPFVSKISTEFPNSPGSYLRIRSKPNIQTVIKHFVIICLNFNQILGHKLRDHEFLFTHTYKYLTDNCSVTCDLDKFHKMKCILSDDKLFYPRNLVFSLETILRGYLFKVPDSLLQYRSFFELVGVTDLPTYQHYADVLEDIECDTTLGEERKGISINTFHLFIALLRKAEDSSCTSLELDAQSIKVLSEDFNIVPLESVIYLDNTRLKIHLKDFPDLSHVQVLLELPPNSLGSCDPPASLKIKQLSEIIHESLGPSLLGICSNPRFQIQSNALEYLLKCREFSQGLIRIYYDATKADGNGNLNLIRIKNDCLKDITKDPKVELDPKFLTIFQVLQKLTIKIVNHISLQITNDQTGRVVQKSDIYYCFIENSVLYANGDKITDVSFFNDLTYALNLHLGNIFSGMLFALELCLSCDNPCDIMHKLDSYNIQQCPFISSISLPQSQAKPSISPINPIARGNSKRSSAARSGVTRPMLFQIIHTDPDPTSHSLSVTDLEIIPDTFTAKLWIRTAQCDLRAAKKLIYEDSDSDIVFPSHACTNCFECAMKTCIAILYLHRFKEANISCQRNLDILLEFVEKFFSPSNNTFADFKFYCISLLNFDENARNPLMTPGIGCCLPMEQISVSTAREAIENCSQIFNILKSEFPIFAEIMFPDADRMYNRPPDQSLIMAQLENFQISADFYEEDLPTSCDEFTAVARNFFNTLPKAIIISIIKIHHKVCWDNFVHNVKLKVGFQADTTHTSLSAFRENTLLIKPLFHGSSRTNPQVIMRDPLGFNIEYARNGYWGTGIYFAVNASYSHRYAHIEGDIHSMFLSKVFVGNAKFEEPDRDITQPPQGYHTITGTHRAGTRVYIIYENGLAYPGYLIKYRMPPS